LIIVISSAKLAIETYYLDYASDSQLTKLFNDIDYVLTGFFTIEALIQMITYGFIFDKGSYTRKVENVMDFFIVVTSLIDIGL
jgi:type I site-specific restriction-modification system R (restriction) subunit